MPSAAEKMELAKRHLRRVEVALDPPDWTDLSLYGQEYLERVAALVASEEGG